MYKSAPGSRQHNPTTAPGCVVVELESHEKQKRKNAISPRAPAPGRTARSHSQRSAFSSESPSPPTFVRPPGAMVPRALQPSRSILRRRAINSRFSGDKEWIGHKRGSEHITSHLYTTETTVGSRTKQCEWKEDQNPFRDVTE